MRKKSLLALLLALMMILSGCALVTVDEAKDNARVIVDVNGETVNKQTVNAAVQNAISQNQYYNQLYSAIYGATYNQYSTDAATLTPQVIQSYVNNLVAKQRAYANGFGEMTEEEKAEIEETAQKDYESFLDQVKNAYFANTELEGDALTEALEAYIAEHDLAKKDDFVQAATDDKAIEKLQNDVVKDLAVTDEELQADFNEKVEADKASNEADPNQYGYKQLSGLTVYYAPAGYRNVRHILVKFSTEDTEDVTAAKAALTEAQDALTAAEEGTDTTELQAAVDAAQIALDAANHAAKAPIRAKADEIYALVTAEGADFNALAAEYSEDTDPDTIFAVRTDYPYLVAPFVEGAMALENAGDVTEPVESTYGYHIIQYVGDVEEGPVELDTVREEIEHDLLHEKEDQALEEALTAWIADANVKTYPDRMN